MERVNDVSTTTMPRMLIVSTIALLVIRLAMIPFEASQLTASADPVAWIKFADFDQQTNPSQKLLLYEFGADWCEPVKRMEGTVLRNKQIAEIIGSRFVPIKVRDRLREDGKNTKQISDLQKKYHVFAFPTLIVASPDGEVVATLVGSVSALSTVHFLARASNSGAKTVK